VRGADNYDSLRGDGLDFIVLDEYASMHPEAWTEVLRPALADKQGSALFIGTPRGHNHFFNLYEWAEDQPDWQRFQFTTEQGGNVTFEELETATHEMDARIFSQEFLATFENLGVGRAYFDFDRAHHVRPLRYNPNFPLVWSLDFNMNPLCSVIGQVVNGIVCILDELILPDSNTLAACEKFLDRTRQWVTRPTIPEPPPEYAQAYEQVLLQQIPPPPLKVEVYGDATGEQRRTSASRTDWQIVKNFFGRYDDRYRAAFPIPSANPPVKDRINCVNAMLCNHAGDRRVLIDPKCKDLIKDLDQVSWKADPYGNSLADLDKSDPSRTHVSDALGYWLARAFSMRTQRGEQAGPRLC
jgi:hypothetical protein